MRKTYLPPVTQCISLHGSTLLQGASMAVNNNGVKVTDYSEIMVRQHSLWEDEESEDEEW